MQINQYNLPKTYALVDDEGKIVEYFRTKAAAIHMKHKYEKLLYKKLKIVSLKEDGAS